MGYKWYVGVTHCHTVASDGKYELAELIKMSKKAGLDYLIITDHDVNCEPFPEVDGLTLIYGTELSEKGGHTNIWGVRNAVDDFDCKDYEKWIETVEEARRRGALICMNHPLCSKCTWRWEKDLSKVDVLEVWNSPMHYDNILCTKWWHEQMALGQKTPVVGGSDYHRDYFFKMLTWPVTYVYAKSSSPEDILEGIAAGRTTICRGVGKTFVELRCGENLLGDTVELTDETAVTVSVKNMKKDHRLMVFDKDGACFKYTAEKNGDYSFDVPVKKSGFVCAHVEFDLSRMYAFIYDQIVRFWMPHQKGMKMPPFIYAQSGAIYFE